MTPARRAWLKIGVPVCLVLVGWAGLNLVALAGPGQFRVSHDIPASTGRVSVNFSSGNLLLRQAAGDHAELTGTAHYSPSFTTKVTAAGTDFGYNCNFPVGNCYLNAAISVPPGTPTSVYTSGGNATAVGTTSRVTLNSDGGDITATAITAVRVTASTGGGDITVVFTSVPANVEVNTDGGNITIVVPPGSTHYNLTERTDGGTTSGKVPTDSSSPNVITATSGGGDISVSQS